MLSYYVVNRVKFLHYKLSYDIRLEMVGGALPTKGELTEIAERLWDDRYGKTFVCFYLPGMQIDAGAYATGHSGQDVRILGWPTGVN